MGEDVPLTEFGGDRDESDDESTGVPSDSEESADESVDEPAEEPAEADSVETPSLTYTSSPDGAPCAACGETVENRWRAGEGGVTPDEDGAGGVDDPDALVCPDCKEW